MFLAISKAFSGRGNYNRGRGIAIVLVIVFAYIYRSIVNRDTHFSLFDQNSLWLSMRWKETVLLVGLVI